MFDFNQPFLIAGLLLGLSSSLHCFAMCSGIAASLCLAATSNNARPGRDLFIATLLIQSGRISGYMIAGAIVGGVGSSIFGSLDRSVMNTVLRWGAAVSLGWIGFSMICAQPLPRLFYRIASFVADLLNAIGNAVRLPRGGALFLSGAVWGFLPCAMVYAALFYAMLSASWLGGAVAMLGFGLGTLPPLVGASVGVPLLRRRAVSAWLRTVAGLAIMMIGVISIVISPAMIADWCRLG
jgi:hypothetical protein